VMTVWQTDTKKGTKDEASAANFIDWRERNRSFSYLALAEPFSLDYLGPDGPETLENAVVTKGFFDALGATPILGRDFADEEFEKGRNQVVMLSESVWRSRFGADSTVIGRKVVLDNAPLTVIGVMPAAVDVPWEAVTWTPKVFREDELRSRGSNYFAVFGRLKDGITPAAAQREMDAIAADLSRAYPATNATTGVAVVPIADSLLGASRKGLYIMMGAMGFVLLIACVNVASLQLAQAVRRRRELATRATLGAGTWRIARQLFAESLVLAGLGGALGIVVAQLCLAGIRTLAPANMPRVEGMQLNPAVFGFTAAVTLLAAMAFGLAPVLQTRKLRLAEAVASNGRSGSGTRGRRRSQSVLVVVEVALALVLLVGAGLLVRSFRTLVTVDRGFEPDNVLVVTVQAWTYYPTPAQRIAFAREAITQLNAIPGVRVAGMTSALPLSPRIGSEAAAITVEGRPVSAGEETRTSAIAAVTPGYFEALQIPMRAGRQLTDTDRDSTEGVVLVNEAFARKYWPGESAIGKRVTFGFQRQPAERQIVGVVADVRRDGLDRDAAPIIYAPHAQAPTGAMHFTIRTEGPPRMTERAARAALASMNASMPVSSVTTLEDLFSLSVRDRKFHLALLTAFSLTALLLSAIGIYGVLSQAIGERTQEIGVRIAVGASALQVLLMVLRQGSALAAGGILIGLAGAIALTRLLSEMLYRITPLDPVSFGAALVLLFVTAIVACWVPARRAAKLDPVEALRRE
jgi:putative ABC transport system permease protein